MWIQEVQIYNPEFYHTDSFKKPYGIHNNQGSHNSPENAHVWCQLRHREHETVGGTEEVPGPSQLVRQGEQAAQEQGEKTHCLQHRHCTLPIQAAS